MEKLQTQLEYFVKSKITHDRSWQGVDVYLSGHQVSSLNFLTVHRCFVKFDKTVFESCSGAYIVDVAVWKSNCYIYNKFINSYIYTKFSCILLNVSFSIQFQYYFLFQLLFGILTLPLKISI